ncbi:aspartate kinase [Opitutia bacterium ISCC 51]|nr:aspartate kinase [Opitutae bacterium ISCC 51]QXD26865.1 aspartate kinase [Opitutae bacterium ISCC 52]
MARIVQKYGGTSVGTVERIQAVAERIKETYDNGNEVVVVVSARSGVTNELVSRAKSINPEPNEREMDMLLAVGEQETIALMAMALHALGIPAESRTGPQAGVITDDSHTKARIVRVEGGGIPDLLAAGKVVIVAGFQGINSVGQISTLGRGGSDLSAVAMAAGLEADLCQIFTDVEGVFTADPRIVKDAVKLDEVSYDEMLELASMGTKVMQARAVEFAKKYKVTFEVRSSFNNEPGTIVKEEVSSMEEVLVRGVAVDKSQTQVVVSDLPDEPGTAGKLFTALAESNILVDMIVQNIGREGKANMTFTIPKDDTLKAEGVVNQVFQDIGGTLTSSTDIAKLSVVGVGMRSHSGVAAKLFKTLADGGINIKLIGTSEIKISVAINLEHADLAAQLAHTAFDLKTAG